MTTSEKQELKQKISKVLIDYLTVSIGYPNCTNDQIMGQVRNMWVKLEEAGLIQPGMTFKAFAEHANNQYMLAHVKDIMRL